ncbi:MAG: hypothetical protein IJ655_08310 [Lachnospiraceae bacterium]|nr:hypothetical protein [Lachnospiraceae bacterium]
MGILDEYLKVSAVAEYASSEDSASSNLFWYSKKRESSKEFGGIFKKACDELKQEAGNTHQTKGYIAVVGARLI